MKLAIIDDHNLLLEVLRNSLSNVYPEAEIKTYNDGHIFLEADFSMWLPDVVICDLMMPSISGLEIIDELNNRNQRSIRIIILSSIADIFTIRECMRRGAAAYLSKESSLDEVSSAINTVLNGKVYTSAALKRLMVNYVFQDDEISYFLSNRESLVLNHICMGKTPKEIAFESKISLHTVHEYVKSIMKKFKVNRTADVILFAIQKGLYIPNT